MPNHESGNLGTCSGKQGGMGEGLATYIVESIQDRLQVKDPLDTR